MSNKLEEIVMEQQKIIEDLRRRVYELEKGLTLAQMEINDFKKLPEYIQHKSEKMLNIVKMQHYLNKKR